MKNIYLFGASDDLAELDSDCGLRAEGSPEHGLKVNDMVFGFDFDGDWGVFLKEGSVPDGWKLFAVEGNAAASCRRKPNAGLVIHLQAPDDADVNVFEWREEEEVRSGWRKA